MARAKKVVKEQYPLFASKERIQEVKNEIRDLEMMLAEDKQRKVPKITEPDSVRAEILKKQQYIERNSPSILKGDKANKAYKEAKECEKIIRENMLKSSMFSQRYPKGSDVYSKQQKFEEAVKQQMKFMTDPVIKTAALKYKHLMSRLDPSDPTVRNIERFRSAR